jgi:hypothetical protein
MNEVPSDTTAQRPNVDRFIALIGFFVAILFFVFQANGVEMNWVISLLIYAAVALGCAFSCLRHAVPHFTTSFRYATAVGMFICVAIFGFIGTRKQYRREHPMQQTVLQAHDRHSSSETGAMTQIAPAKTPASPPAAKRSATPRLPSLSPLFYDKDDLSFWLVNEGDIAAREPKFSIGIANLSRQYLAGYDGKEPDPEPLPIPTKKLDDYVRPHESLQTFIVMNDMSRTYVKSGDRLFGEFILTCLNCASVRYYWIYWHVGIGGWYAEIPKGSKRSIPFIKAQGTSDNDIDVMINNLVPVKLRRIVFTNLETLEKAIQLQSGGS